MSVALVGVAVLVFTGFSVLSASPASATGGFDDVDPGAYYAEAVDWLVARGITSGTSPTTFSPNQAVTRGQMAAFLYRYGLDAAVWTHPFTDVPVGVFYENAVGWLAARGITSGTSPTTFSPNQTVTRGQMAAFLWRYAGEPPVSGSPSTFSDVPSGAYYSDAVAWLVDKGITTGTSPTTFSPNQTVTRGQMAAFLWRLAGGPATALCATQTQISTTECLALVALYNSTNGDTWSTNTGWLTDPDPCTWHNVTCTTGAVTELWLSHHLLSGAIPRELGNLTNLTRLTLTGNQLSGAIPAELGNLTNLTRLFLFNNQLSGAIPAQLGNLTNLTSLDLSNNQLSGAIPSELGNLTNLHWLYLHDTQLSGAIPAQLGNLTNLKTLQLSSNQLSGAIPSELGNLTNLHTLWLVNNQLSGAIPSELGNLTNLTSLGLRGQTGCLTAADATLASWLAGFDSSWNDGCT